MLRRLKEDVEKNLASKEETIVEVRHLFAFFFWITFLTKGQKRQSLMTILVCKIPSIHLLINMIKAYLIRVHSIYMYYVYIIKKILLKLKAYNRYLTLLYAHRVIWKCIFFCICRWSWQTFRRNTTGLFWSVTLLSCPKALVLQPMYRICWIQWWSCENVATIHILSKVIVNDDQFYWNVFSMLKVNYICH